VRLTELIFTTNSDSSLSHTNSTNQEYEKPDVPIASQNRHI